MKNSSEILNSKQSDKTGESSQSSDTSSKWSILEKLADKYDVQERGRVDEIKEEIQQDPDQYGAYIGMPSEARISLENEKIDAPPSILRKIGRLALDRIGIRPVHLEERRHREAISIALDEHKKGYEEYMQEDQRRQEEAQQRREEAQREQEEERQRREEEQFIEAMENWRTHKKEYFQQQREQELNEERLNEALLTTDTLEEAVSSSDPRVEKTEKEYNGKTIPVYTLREFPFDGMLVSNIGYKDVDQGGSRLATTLINDPSLWMTNEEQTEDLVRKHGHRAYNISTSLISSERLYTKFKNTNNQERNIYYGFSHIDAGTLLNIRAGDATTGYLRGQRIKQDFYKESAPRAHSTLDTLESKSNNDSRSYNEIVLKRYDDQGRPHAPDYIITEDGVITEGMLKHAEFFGIPIINIDTTTYETKDEDTTLGASESADRN